MRQIVRKPTNYYCGIPCYAVRDFDPLDFEYMYDHEGD